MYLIPVQIFELLLSKSSANWDDKDFNFQIENMLLEIETDVTPATDDDEFEGRWIWKWQRMEMS